MADEPPGLEPTPFEVASLGRGPDYRISIVFGPHSVEVTHECADALTLAESMLLRAVLYQIHCALCSGWTPKPVLDVAGQERWTGRPADGS